MAIDWNKVGRRANAAITAAEGKEKSLYAKLTRNPQKKADLQHDAKVSARQAKYLRGK